MREMLCQSRAETTSVTIRQVSPQKGRYAAVLSDMPRRFREGGNTNGETSNGGGGAYENQGGGI